MDKVIVKVISRQMDAAGEVNHIEMMAEGRHYYRNGKHYILYDDRTLGDHEKTSTVLKIAADSLLLMRKGEVVHEQFFAQKQESSSVYHTPYGEMDMLVRTNKLEIVYGNVSGNIDVDYTLAINGVLQGNNELHIAVCAAASEKHKLN
jgi:uncharacterized beta-barrel protein YwiB (DUF1934 family)